VRESFEEAINTSVNQTMSRTILTTLTVFIVVAALYFFGGEVINDFAFTLLIGLISGTYSTVYIAAPVLVDWLGSKKK
jgi:preprotein translocase subunit SecF